VVICLGTFKLTLAYDGTDFIGWQRQADGRSVQALVEEALSRIEGAPVSVVGAGRTDAGVHALGQVASATLSRGLDASRLRRAINAMLPSDVRVVAVAPAQAGFNARYAAHATTYRYRMVCDEIISPFVRRFAWHVPGSLDIAAMQRSAGRLVGRHDFSAFQSTGSDVTTTLRTMLVSRLRPMAEPDNGQAIIYDVTGEGFLRHMVRAIVGTLVEIGAGRLKADGMDEVVASRDRQKAGPTAPAHGLFLVGVTYGEGEPNADDDLE